jgi:two-component system, OmpR family, copper resistance phosphate regulon response regulator CusR
MENRKNVLVIEDESMVQISLEEHLGRSGFNVYAYSSAEDAIKSELVNLTDVVIMDIGLPGMNGLEATQLIRRDFSGVPVIMLTAYSDVNSRLQGFETGADDYIIKPFFMEELVARLNAVLKRYEMIPGGKKYYIVGDLHINTKTKLVQRNKTAIKLSITEFNLLTLLADGQGAPISKEEILKKIWNGRYSVSDNTIEVYINILRNKIDKHFTRKLIHTRPGYGYYLSEKP